MLWHGRDYRSRGGDREVIMRFTIWRVRLRGRAKTAVANCEDIWCSHRSQGAAVEHYVIGGSDENGVRWEFMMFPDLAKRFVEFYNKENEK